MLKIEIMKITVTLLILLMPVMVESSKDDDELNLMRDLFTNYSKVVRPVLNKTKPVKVIFGLAYVQLVDLDEKDQYLVSNVWLRQKWNNALLRWDPKDYGGIKKINVNPTKIWLPDIVLYNNAQKGSTAGTMYGFKTKVILEFDGNNTWFSPSIIRSGCNIDITYFPFDDQVCNLQFGSWTYHGGFVDIWNETNTADIKPYLKSAEFTLLQTIAIRKVYKYSCCPEIYPNVIFYFHFRRQPGFFLYNVIIPSLVITCFAILTFSSPHLTGERVGLAIESFLSLSFLCLMVAGSIPVISDVTPLITKFLLTCMVLISLAVLLNLISHNLLCTTKIPPWIRMLFLHILGPLMGVCEGRNKGIQKRRKSMLIREKLPEMAVMGKTALWIGQQKSEEGAILKKRIPTQGQGQQDGAYRRIPKNAKKPVKPSIYSLEGVLTNVEDLVRKSHMDAISKANRDFWRMVGNTVDRIFLMAFLLSFIFVSAVMLLQGFGHHIRASD